jgi:quinol monooxygenase YgiN
MVGGLKIILVADGREQEFESLFGELRSTMRDREPGCLLYSLLKSRANPRAYIVHEQYRDAAALAEHEPSPHGKIYFPKIAPSWKASRSNISMELLRNPTEYR